MNNQIAIAEILRRAADEIMAMQEPQKGSDERIFDALKEGTVFVEFRKVNGEYRSMLATRADDTYWSSQDYDPEADSVAVVDIELNEVRSFRYDSVVRAYVVTDIIV